MGSIQLLGLGVVKAFRGYNVTLGVVQVGDDAFVSHLDESFAEVAICHVTAKPGGILQALYPVIFNRIKGEYQDELQVTLQAQLVAGNDVDIDFH